MAEKCRLLLIQKVLFKIKVTTKEISEIDSLPSEEKGKMDELAEEIANSFVQGTSPIMAYMIVGHADKDPRGADFEMHVSVARAEAAQTWLIKQAKVLVQQRGGNPSEVDNAEFSLFGYGSSNLYTRDMTFPAREKNRRIVIKYAAVEMDPLLDAIGYGPNLARAIALTNLQPTDERIDRIRCVLAKLADPSTDDTYFEWGSLRQIAGGLRGLTDEQVLVIARNIIKTLRHDIANNNLYGFPSVPDNIVIQNLIQWDENVRNTKNQLVARIAVEGATAGQVQKSVARFIAKNENNPKSILSCFKNS